MPSDDGCDLPATHQYLSEILNAYTIPGGTIDDYRRMIAGLDSAAVERIRAAYELVEWL